MKAILNRLKEPSTWAGFAALGTLFGVKPELISAVGDAAIALFTVGAAPNPATIVGAVTAVCSAAAVLIPEHKPALLVVKGQG